jgi:hypothetical protein
MAIRAFRQLHLRPRSGFVQLSAAPAKGRSRISTTHGFVTVKLDTLGLPMLRVICMFRDATRRGSGQFAPETAARPDDSSRGLSSLQFITGPSNQPLPAAFRLLKSSLRDYNGVLPLIAVSSPVSFGLRP